MKSPSLGLVACALLLLPTLPAQVTATAVTIGQGCPQFGSYAATLSMTPPVIGQSTVVIPAGLPAAEGVLWASLGPAAAPTTVYPGCSTWLDLATARPVTPFMTGTAGMGWIPMTLPNDPALVGMQVTLQAIIVANWQPPGALPVVTEALEVLIGDQS